MIKRQLYIDGFLMDIAEVAIPLNFQCSEVADMTGIVANFSYSIKLPKTANNLQAIEQAQEFSNETDYALVKHTGRYYIYGMPIFEDAEVRVLRIIEQIEITIMFGNYGLFSEIEKLKLSELTTIADVLLWNYAMTASTNAGWALAEFGGTVINGTIHPDRVRPYVKAKSLFDAIVPAYTMPASIASKIGTLNIPLFTENSDTAHLNDIVVSLVNSGSWTILSKASTAVNNYQTTSDTLTAYGVVSDTYQLFTNVNPYIVIVPFDGWYSINSLLWVTGISPLVYGGHFEVNMNFLNDAGAIVATNGAGQNEVNGFGGSTNYVRFIGGTAQVVNLKKGTLRFQVTAKYIGAAYHSSFNNLTLSTDPTKHSTISIQYLHADARNLNLKTAFKLKYPIIQNLPSISQKDYIKSIMQLFGLMIYIKSGSPVFFTFKEVYENIQYSKDWSEYLILTDKFQSDIDFSSDVAEVNRLKYKSNDKLNDTEYGNSSIPAVNQFLKEKDIVINQAFSATENANDLVDLSNNDFKQCNLPVWEIQTNGTYKVVTMTPRICQDSTESVNLGMASVYGEPTGIAGIMTRHVHRFEANGDGLLYSELIQNYWQRYSEIVNKFKQTKLKFILPPEEIIDFKFDAPIYLSQYSRYFFVKKITNWQLNTITEVELIIL